MTREDWRIVRGHFRLFRPYFAVCLAFIACASHPELPDDAMGRETCVGACARRERTGCLEPSLRAGCVATCERIRARGLYAPERCVK